MAFISIESIGLVVLFVVWYKIQKVSSNKSNIIINKFLARESQETAFQKQSKK